MMPMSDRQVSGHLDQPVEEAIEHCNRFRFQLDDDPAPIGGITMEIHEASFGQPMNDPLGVPLGRARRTGERRERSRLDAFARVKVEKHLKSGDREQFSAELVRAQPLDLLGQSDHAASAHRRRNFLSLDHCASPFAGNKADRRREDFNLALLGMDRSFHARRKLMSGPVIL